MSDDTDESTPVVTTVLSEISAALHRCSQVPIWIQYNETKHYICISRYHRPSTLLERLMVDAQLFSEEEAKNMWFRNAKEQVISWNVPLGVYYDIEKLWAMDNDPEHAIDHTFAMELELLPSDPPPKLFPLSFPLSSFSKQLYFNALKESSFIRHGNAQRIDELSIGTLNDIWASMEKDQLESFEILSTLMPIDHYSIPVRLWHLDDFPRVSMLHPDVDSTLSDCLPETCSQIMIQGVCIPLDCNVASLSRVACGADGFLDIIAHHTE